MNTTENHLSTSTNPSATPPHTARQMPPVIVKPIRFPGQPQEWKINSLRECPTPAELHLCDTPERAVAYWGAHGVQHPYFDPECECMMGDKFADCLLVRLPKAAATPRAIRNVCAVLQKRKLGVGQPDDDIGETHLYLSMS